MIMSSINVLTEYLNQYYDEWDSMDFYRYIFPEGELEKAGERVTGKYNAIAVEVLGKKQAKRYTVTDDLSRIRELQGSENFCLMSPISYAGKTRKSEYARFLYAMAFDLDSIVCLEDGTPQGLIDLFYQIEGPAQRLPMPTFVASSGTGLHLYYVFEKPIPLFKNIVDQMKEYKREMTRMLWHGYITTLEDNVQQESVFQGFRIVGTITKTGSRVRVFETGKRVTMDYMNSFVREQFQVRQFAYKSDLSLAQAKEKYPEWYQKRIIDKKPKASWTTKRDLYDWWKRRITFEAREGHRYYCLMTLAIYAKKAGIEYEELERDAFELMPEFEKLTRNEYNHFDEEDVIKALEAYNDAYITYPINSIANLTDISIQKNKRNGRLQVEHLKRARAVQMIDFPNGEWRNKEGRPVGSGTKEQLVKEYIREHPELNVTEIARALKVSRPTVYKYME